MKKIVFFTVFMLLMSFVLAQNALVEEYSKELLGQKLPGALGTIFGDEKINFHLETDEGVVIVAIITEDKVVKSIEEKKLEKPSLNVYADEETLMQISKSNEPLLSLKKALDEKKIRYKAVGLLNKVKFSFLSIFSNIASLFMSEDVEKKEEVKEEIHKEDVMEKMQKDDVMEEKESADDQESLEEENDDNLLTGEVVTEIGASKSETPSGVSSHASRHKSEISTEPENNEHVVELTVKGFEPHELTIKVGDTVTWKNIRRGNFNQGMIIGVRECRDVRSKVLSSGDSYTFTFEEKNKCTIVDGIWTKEDSKIIVE